MPDIDDPFKPSDATVLRPRPGAGKRGQTEPASVSSLHRASVGAAAAVDVVAPPAPDMAGSGLNVLVRAAIPLLLLAGHIRGTLTAPELQGLRRHAADEIRRFEERAHAAGVSQQVVLAARYALCAALDEAVLSTPWGAHSEWAQQTLLVVMHREAWGGEKFFEMLDRISQDPARHIELMELQYLCIAFGFAGKYQVLDRGHARLADVQHDLYRTIRTYRGAAPAELSPRWRGLTDSRHRLIRYVPWWVVGAAALAILTVTFAVYHTMLGNVSAPVDRTLANIGREEFTGPPPPAAPVAGRTLKGLLELDEGRGTLKIDEQGGRTKITVFASDLFSSGSATPSASHTAMLQRIAAALNQVPGRVMVIGHTDDQPLRSLRFANNFQLSQERAASVVRILQQGSDTPSRFESTGMGSSELLYPEPTPENRARNRRVEIIHVRGS
jgi:type VI secretion system protein ImpK